MSIDDRQIADTTIEAGAARDTLAPSLPQHIAPSMREALAEAKAGLQAAYGDRLRRVVLYGSRARGDADPDSDVDLLVVLERLIENEYREIKRMGNLRFDLLERYGLYFSFHLYTEDEYEDRRRPFIRNVHEDGFEL